MNWLGLFPLFLGENNFFAVLGKDYNGSLQSHDPGNAVYVVLKPDVFANLWHFFFAGPVGIVLIGEAAEQSIAEAGNFCRVERQILCFRHLDRHGFKFLQE